MMSGIVLSGAVRSSLLTLQNTADLQAKVQDRLATGKRVNSALDNPTNFFTAAGLSRRANDLSSLLDGMSQGIKTIEAADNAMKAITKTIETMQANVRQARQDKSFKGVSYSIDAAATGNVSFSGGAVGTTGVNVALTNASAGTFVATNNFAATTIVDAADTVVFDISVDGGAADTVTISQATLAAVGDGDATLDDVTEFQELLTDAGVTGVSASLVGGKLTLTSSTLGTSSSVTISNRVETDADNDTTDNTSIGAGTSTAGAATGGTVRTVDEMVTAINATTALANKVKATNDGGKLRIENLSTEALTVTGISGTDGDIDGSSGTGTIGGNDVRKNLMSQFNELRRQLDKLAADASYNGINLVRADKLKITFNEFGTSNIEIQAKNTAGVVRGIGTESTSLNIGEGMADEFSSDSLLDTRLDKLNEAFTVIQTQSSSFGAALTTVQNRQEFTRSMINTLQQGADSLTLADSNEEGANLLALNTRQQLSQTALSLASQASQAVLRLF
jgi:flagellin